MPPASFHPLLLRHCLRLIEKFVVDFPFVLIELFSLGITDETLRANIDWKLAALSLTVYTRRNFVADFLQVKCDFRQKRPFCVLRFAPLWGGGGLRQRTMFLLGSLIGKRVLDLILVLIKLFAMCYG